MTIQDLINKHHLSPLYLAERIGMQPELFHKKLHPRNSNEFTNSELTQIHDVLIGLKSDIEAIDSSEFDDIMKAILNH
jgi:hypothetical protein